MNWLFDKFALARCINFVGVSIELKRRSTWCLSLIGSVGIVYFYVITFFEMLWD